MIFTLLWFVMCGKCVWSTTNSRSEKPIQCADGKWFEGGYLAFWFVDIGISFSFIFLLVHIFQSSQLLFVILRDQHIIYMSALCISYITECRLTRCCHGSSISTKQSEDFCVSKIKRRYSDADYIKNVLNIWTKHRDPACLEEKE